MQSNDIIKVLENVEAQSFIRSNIKRDIASLALKHKHNSIFNMAVCLKLIKVYRKCQKKLPFYFDNLLAIDERSYAQSTSEQVATFKSTFLSGKTLLDLTAGIGIDSLFLSKSFAHVVAIEQNVDLHTLAAYNVAKLNVVNLHRICAEANKFLNTDTGVYDLIYLDPDRRSEFGRSVALEYLSPNVLDLLPQLKCKTSQVYIKLSPLFDINEVYRKFTNVSKVYVIAEKSEIKEIGLFLDFNLDENIRTVQLVDVATGFNHTLMLNEVPNKAVSFNAKARHLHIPIALVSKCGVAPYFLRDVREYYKHSAYELYFSDLSEIAGFRTFTVLDTSSLQQKSISKMLALYGIKQCNIIIKGASKKALVWHKKLKTKDGGEYYLWLLNGKKSEAILAKLISLAEI